MSRQTGADDVGLTTRSRSIQVGEFEVAIPGGIWVAIGANLYSLMQTCAVNGVDGYKYLRSLLVQLPMAQTADDYEALLPWAIALPAD